MPHGPPCYLKNVLFPPSFRLDEHFSWVSTPIRHAQAMALNGLEWHIEMKGSGTYTDLDLGLDFSFSVYVDYF